jgi:hypothetical protein
VSKTSTTQPVKIDTNSIVYDVVFSPLGPLIGLLICLIIFSNWKSKKQTNILAKGALATDTQLENARLKVIKLIAAQKFNDVGCYLGTPKGTQIVRANGVASIIVGLDRDRVYLEAMGGTYYQGLPGSGKSFSGLLPQVRSFFDIGCGTKNGFPVAFYDVKFSTHSSEEPSPSSQIAGYAKARSYRVHVFAPGVKASAIPDWARPCTINLLDFVRDAQDIEMARQVVLILLRNLVQGFDKMQAFFRDACISGLQGLVLLAKLTDKPDLLTCRQLLNHPRLLQIITSPLVSESVRMVFDTFRKAMAVAETFSGIESTISNVFSTVLMPAIAPSICDKTTIPLDLDGNDLLIFGVDGERRDVVCPIIASVIHLHVNRNLLRPRRSPYGLSLDEYGSVYLPDLDEWPNQYRSAGLILQVATQSPDVPIKRYGKDAVTSIIKGLANHLIFQSAYDDAKSYASMVGQTDVVYESTGSSSSKSGGSASKSEHRSKIDLLEAHELVQAPRGKALIITRSTGDKQKASVPFFREIIIPQWDIDAIASSVKLWDDGLTRPDTITRFTDSDYTLRTESINEFFGSSFVDEPENKAESVDSASDEETESIGLAVAFLQQ